MPPRPIVVVHGNPASNLLDLYLTQPDAVYTLARGGWPAHLPGSTKLYQRIPFHPDDPTTTLNVTGNAVAPSRIAAVSAFYIPYENLIERLKRDIGSEDEPAPVFPFAYDWRFDTSTTAPKLGDFINEVLRIVSLLPQYKAAPPQSVDIVAHSFGGLVVARYLRSCQIAPARPTKVTKVATIATPFRGAVDAFYTMIKDLDQREAARTLPSVYALLPYFANATVDVSTPGAPQRAIDLISDPVIWNGSSVERSLSNYCARMGSVKSGAQRLAELRQTAAAQRSDLASLNVANALPSLDNWLPIVGIGRKTNVQARVVSVQAGAALDAEFAFVQDDNGDSTGDNTVPFLGAIPPFDLAHGAAATLTPRERLVCITQDDVGPHEMGDWAGIGEEFGKVSLHSILPMMDAVQQILISFLRDAPTRFKAKAHPAPGVPVGAVNWPNAWGVSV